jgi:4'-phosphopantetheinyl transferase
VPSSDCAARASDIELSPQGVDCSPVCHRAMPASITAGTLSAPPLNVQDVHIWCVSEQRVIRGATRRSLSHDEMSRASRFRNAIDADRFLTSRAALRVVLGRYTGQHPSEIRFVVGEYGKPHLRRERGDRGPLAFNVTHSGSWCLIAVAREPVGIDIERITPVREGSRMFASILCPAELSAVARLPARSRVSACFSIWTRKEAVLKGMGIGIAGPVRPDGLYVGLTRNRSQVLDGSVYGDWTLRNLHGLPGYAISLATACPPVVSMWSLTDQPPRDRVAPGSRRVQMWISLGRRSV